MIVGYLVVIRSLGRDQYIGPFPTIEAAMACGKKCAPDVKWNWAYLNGDDGEELK